MKNGSRLCLWAYWCTLLSLAMTLTSCASRTDVTTLSSTDWRASTEIPSGSKASDWGSQLLESIGLKKPELPDTVSIPDSALPDWRVTWRLNTSPSLNVDEQGQSLAVVARFYRLRSADAFLRLPPDAFGDANKEKAALGEDLVSVRELQLLPNQQIASQDKVSRESRFLAIVTLFRKPAQQRWRYVFDTSEAAKTGLSLGIHACAMSVQQGSPVEQAASVARSVAVPCP